MPDKDEIIVDGVRYPYVDVTGVVPWAAPPGHMVIYLPKPDSVEPEDVQGYDGADEMFKLREDVQRVTGGLERDVALLQDNQRNVARALIPLEHKVAKLEKAAGEGGHNRFCDIEMDVEALRSWISRIAVEQRRLATQLHRAIDRMVLVEGDGKLIMRLEDARK